MIVMSKTTTTKILMPKRGGGYMYDVSYNHTSYLLIKMYAMCNKINPDFRLPIVNFSDYAIGCIAIDEANDFKFVVYITPIMHAVCDPSIPMSTYKSGVEDRIFVGEDTTELVRVELGFIQLIKYFQTYGRWSFKTYSDPGDCEGMENFEGVYKFGMLIINNHVHIRVDMNPFRYNWDSDILAGEARLEKVMNTLSNKKCGVNGVMPQSLFRMYSEMRWRSKSFRMPYIPKCHQIRTLDMYEYRTDQMYVVTFMKPGMSLYDQRNELILPLDNDKYKIPLFDKDYSEVYGIEFDVFTRLVYGRLKYKLYKDDGKRIHYMENIYPIAMFKYYARASKNNLARTMFILMDS